MKTKAIFLNIFLLSSLLSGLLSVQPTFRVHALSGDKQDVPALDTIAYVGSDGNIWLINAMGEEKRKITADGGYTDLQWSPDGQHLALVKRTPSSNRFSLYLHDLSQNPSRKIADDVQIFAWDPVGDRIAYYSDQIYIYNAILGETETTISAQYPYNWLIWDLPGEKIMYYSYDAGGIKSVDINTKSEAMVYSKASDEVGPPSFEELKYYPLTGYFFGWDYQSEGSGIPLVIDSQGTLIDLGEKTVKTVYPDATDGFFVTGYPSADWSPDGKQLAYGNNWDFGNGDLFLVNIDSFELIVLPAKGINPRWSPDGKKIAFASEKGGLSLLDMDSQMSQQILPDLPNRYLDEVCGFGGCSGYRTNSANEPQWSPDGQKLILPFRIGFFIANTTGGNPAWVKGGLSAEWMPASGITDLRVEPDLYQTDNIEQGKYPIRLSWQTPGNLWNAVNLASEFEVRMSDAPLDEENWDDARMLANPPSPQAGITVEMRYNLSQADTGKIWFFGLKSRSVDGVWSPISNIVEYIDSGFRPDQNGYNFTNGTDDWGIYPHYVSSKNIPPDFEAQDFYEMFSPQTPGFNPFCVLGIDTGSGCVLWPEYYVWIEQVNQASNFGRCFGMAVTSSMIFHDHSQISRLGEGFTNVYDPQVNLGVGSVRKQITYHHVEQWTQPYLDYKFSIDPNTQQRVLDAPPSHTLASVQSALSTQQSIILLLGSRAGFHAVSPISVSLTTGRESTIFVYDNEIPGAITPIDIYQTDEWVYNKNGNYHSLASGYMLFVVPVDEIISPESIGPVNYGVLYIWLQSKVGTMFIENENGEQTGTVDGNFVNQIPGAQINPIINDDTFGNSEPIYILPSSEQYSVHLQNGDSNVVSLSQFGANYAVVVDGIQANFSDKDVIEITSKGDQLKYLATRGQNVSVKLTSRSDTGGFIFNLSDLRIDAARTLEISHDSTSQQLIIKPASDQPFDLEIAVFTSAGEQRFSYEAISFVGATALAVDVEQPGRTLTVKLDLNNDGEFDKTTRIRTDESTLENVIEHPAFGFIVCGGGFIMFIIGSLGLMGLRRRIVK